MSVSIEKKRILYAAVFPLLFIILLWVIQLLQWGMDWNFSFLGIYPQMLKGVPGIFLNCFIHSGFDHLWSNTLSLFTLLWFLFYFYSQIVWKTLGYLWILTGLFLWLIGRPGVHVGASGIVYGLTFFLFFSGVLRQYAPLMAVSLVVVFLYGSIIWGMFPFAERIKPDMSWEGHLSGAVSGTFVAVLLRKQGPQKPPPVEEKEEDEQDDDDPYWLQGTGSYPLPPQG
ncbi:MAG: rhomboid family intramembrane serine protease [Candidatus Azobacteroides sp.]|nr:rhomboid family intramembrane serine protease [Candidatus Azobacteroides sp.]